MVIGVHDYDFFNYENVIPNLECGKLLSAARKHRDIGLLAPTLDPEPYTKMYVRKEYEDYKYPQELFKPNVEFGGRAFTKGNYLPLDENIERLAPDFSSYEKYSNYFTSNPKELVRFKRILNSDHCRISLDGKNIFPRFREQLKLEQNHYGIFLHDYNLNNVEGAFEALSEIVNSRYTLDGKPKPIRIGTKFPIQVDNTEDFWKWNKLKPIEDGFYIQYNGIIEDRALPGFVHNNLLHHRTICYNFCYNCENELHLVSDILPKIYPQLLYLRTKDINFSLIYDDNFVTTPELKNLLILLDRYIRCGFVINSKSMMVKGGTLYSYCKHSVKQKYAPYIMASQYRPYLYPQQIRDAFNYVRANNYELFKMFYEWANIQYDSDKEALVNVE